MPSLAPLQIVLIRHPQNQEVVPYEEAIVRALQGGKDAGGYLATGDDLGIQLEVFSDAPTISAPELLDSFCHTVTLVLADQELLTESSRGIRGWLEQCWSHTSASSGRHKMLIVPMDDRIGRQLSDEQTPLRTLQQLQTHNLGERAIRPAMLALRLLHECRVLLATALFPSTNPKPGYLRLFISHAKMDGLPLAYALRHQIKQLGWLEDFYDVDDIPPGSDWKKELEKGVQSSLVVVLRTESYDSRPWCQQEVLWADEYATPAVVVEARIGLNHPGGFLPLDRIPTVRIPDGNLLRILFLALREGLRFLYFHRRVEQMKNDGELPTPVQLRVFSFQPSMSALLRACLSLAESDGSKTKHRLILYPDPTFRAGTYEAAKALVETYLPGAILATPQTIAATRGELQ